MLCVSFSPEAASRSDTAASLPQSDTLQHLGGLQRCIVFPGSGDVQEEKAEVTNISVAQDCELASCVCMGPLPLTGRSCRLRTGALPLSGRTCRFAALSMPTQPRTFPGCACIRLDGAAGMGIGTAGQAEEAGLPAAGAFGAGWGLTGLTGLNRRGLGLRIGLGMGLARIRGCRGRRGTSFGSSPLASVLLAPFIGLGE